jgi:hypothetical protein
MASKEPLAHNELTHSMPNNAELISLLLVLLIPLARLIVSEGA